MKLILLATFIVGSAVAQVIRPGICPAVKGVPNLEIRRLLGKWYEAERYNSIFEVAGKCLTATYSRGKNGTVAFIDKQISSLTGKESTLQGYATPDASEKAKLNVVYSNESTALSRGKAIYWVIDTDYTSYEVLWSCNNLANLVSARFAWILTRKPNPDKAVLEKAYQALDKNNISRKYLSKTEQSDCPADN